MKITKTYVKDCLLLPYRIEKTPGHWDIPKGQMFMDIGEINDDGFYECGATLDGYAIIDRRELNKIINGKIPDGLRQWAESE